MATLWLIGMMGTGKSTVGPLVAARLGRTFVDLDGRVAAAARVSVGEIFAAEGEAGFRSREAAALSAVAGEAVVVACGGGATETTANIARMRETGMVFWLDAPAGALVGRVGEGAGRPMLTQGEVPEGLARLSRVRATGYAAAAHHRVSTEGRTPAEIAEEVVQRWSAWR